MLEPHRIGAYSTLHSFYPCKDVVREGVVQKKQPLSYVDFSVCENEPDAGGGDSCQSDPLPLLRDSLSDGEGERGRKIDRIDGSTVPNLSLTTSLQGKHSAQAHHQHRKKGHQQTLDSSQTDESFPPFLYVVS